MFGQDIMREESQVDIVNILFEAKDKNFRRLDFVRYESIK